MRAAGWIAACALAAVLACGRGPDEKPDGSADSGGGTGGVAAAPALSAPEAARVEATRRTMVAIARGLNSYRLDAPGYPPGDSWEAVRPVLVREYPKVPVAPDSWEHAFHYRSDGPSYTLTSAGPDGRIGTQDDLVLTDGKFTRLPGTADRSIPPAKP